MQNNPGMQNDTSMQNNTNVQKRTELFTLATAAVLYFLALVLFSLWFTQR
jgi:hypothetical protein